MVEIRVLGSQEKGIPDLLTKIDRLERDIKVLSPGQGLSPQKFNELIGTKLKRNMNFEDYFFESDIKNILVKGRNYQFNRRFGIPVRYHDYKKLISQTNVDFAEFHLSYRDLEEDLSNIFNEVQDIDFVVHCPELFSGDHILDLCSKENDYRIRSISELQKRIKETQNESESEKPDKPE